MAFLCLGLPSTDSYSIPVAYVVLSPSPSLGYAASYFLRTLRLLRSSFVLVFLSPFHVSYVLPVPDWLQARRICAVFLIPEQTEAQREETLTQVYVVDFRQN